MSPRKRVRDLAIRPAAEVIVMNSIGPLGNLPARAAQHFVTGVEIRSRAGVPSHGFHGASQNFVHGFASVAFALALAAPDVGQPDDGAERTD
jgi:hypothetical protein